MLLTYIIRSLPLNPDLLVLPRASPFTAMTIQRRAQIFLSRLPPTLSVCPQFRPHLSSPSPGASNSDCKNRSDCHGQHEQCQESPQTSKFIDSWPRISVHAAQNFDTVLVDNVRTNKHRAPTSRRYTPDDFFAHFQECADPLKLLQLDSTKNPKSESS